MAILEQLTFGIGEIEEVFKELIDLGVNEITLCRYLHSMILDEGKELYYNWLEENAERLVDDYMLVNGTNSIDESKYLPVLVLIINEYVAWLDSKFK